MKRLYILEQKIKTLEIILETLVEELMDEGLIDEDRFDNNIIAKIKKLSEELEIEKEEQDEDRNYIISLLWKKR